MKQSGKIGLLYVALGAILWGTSGIAGKVLMDEYTVPSLAIAAWRLCIAAPCLFMVSAISNRRRKIRIIKKDAVWFVVYAVAVAGYQLTYFGAIGFAPVSIVSIITLCLAPVFVALFSPLMLAEKLKSKTVVAAIASIIGTVLVIGYNPTAGSSPNASVGYILAIVAGLCCAFYNLCGRKLAQAYPAFFILGVVFSAAALLLSPALLMTPRLPAEGWLHILYLGVVPSALAYALFQVGLKRCEATSASVVALLEPLTTTVLSAVIIGEVFAVQQLLGGVLMLVAIVLLIFSKPEEQSGADDKT